MKPTKGYLSPFALGLWRLTEAKMSDEQLYELIMLCLDNGITTFDHADIYGNGLAQVQFGRVLKAHPELRERMVIVSKCGIVRNDTPSQYYYSYYETSYDYIMKRADSILQDLQIDYLDVLLIHRVDHLMDYKEVARAFNDLRDSGKVKYFGVSNFLVPQLDAIMKEFPDIFVNQIQISVDHLEHFKNGVIERCSYYDLQVMAYSPLGGGRIFSEDYSNDYLKKQLMTMKHDVNAHTIDQVMLAWIKRHPLNIVVILGSMKSERILNQIQSLDLTLTTKQWYDLYTSSQLERLP